LITVASFVKHFNNKKKVLTVLIILLMVELLYLSS